ncbi:MULTISPECIES: hypothetical protein [Lactococcus]|uniref:hypothetical protein n=1 Tax=Lactococcus TaxID=1357 RepID=UPI000ECF15AA|nr:MULTISPECIES: hypothetical protein [Lactococcus]HAP14802.1 hypothetical protein [Lactococcus sp.]
MVLVASLVLFTAVGLPVVGVVQANDVKVDEQVNSETSNEAEIYQPIQLPSEYVAQEQKSNQALDYIKEKYGHSEIESLTITPEDEERVSKALEEYLSLTGYNPLLRRFGRNWWNSRRFIGTVIDVGLIAVGIGAAARSRAALASLLQTHRTLITRVVQGQILRRVGIGVSGIIMSAIRLATTLAGISIGGAITWGLDRDDGRLDGYILA